MAERVTKGVQEGPRSQRVVQDVRQATLSELGRVGYGGLTIDGVAKAAGVSRTTIYRRWGTRRDLLLSLLDGLLAPFDEVPRGGGLHAELLGLMQQLGRNLADPSARELATLFMVRDEEVQALSREARGRAQAPFRGALERGVASGELSGEADVEVLLHLLFYGMVHWVMDRAEVPSEGDCQRILGVVLGG